LAWRANQHGKPGSQTLGAPQVAAQSHPFMQGNAQRVVAVQGLRQSVADGDVVALFYEGAKQPVKQ
jgi:hypothetical protein